MSKHHVLGLSTDGRPCPVCNVNPQIFRETGTQNVVECARCGLPSGVDLTASAGDRRPLPAANPAWLGVFREYWAETKMKITAPELVEADVELGGRMLALNEWLASHQSLVGRATAASVAPYTSITAVCVQVEGPDGQLVGQAWSLLLPNQAIASAVQLPFEAAGFALGTIITIQTPIPIPGAPAEPPEPERAV